MTANSWRLAAMRTFFKMIENSTISLGGARASGLGVVCLMIIAITVALA
ncbi:MAG: hypothetical protein AAFX86_03000 [Pseudomonadota bacterium]